MRSLVYSVIQEVSVFVRRKQFAPKVTVGVLGCGQVDRLAKRVPEAFEGTVKVVIYCR